MDDRCRIGDLLKLGGAPSLNIGFLEIISDQELRRYAITGRPDLGMPPYDGKDSRPPDFQPLTSEEIDSLVALLACWRQGGPAKRK